MKLGLLLVVSILAAVLKAADPTPKKCRALALSGGGDKGAYEAAVYVGLVNNLPAEDIAYDVVTGVSAGSLNTLGLSPFEPHDVTAASDFLFALWSSIPQNNAFGMWPGGILQGIFFKGGILDLSPGIKWVSEQYGDKTVKRKVSFATTDANSADYIVYDYNASYTQPDDIIESAFASSSIPAAFEPTQRGERTLIDGGVIWNLDVATAIRRCKEVVDDYKDIIVDFVLCGDHKLEATKDMSKWKPLDHWRRGMEISSFYNGMSDYNSSTILFPDVEFRYIIVPSENLSSGLLPLDFSQKQIDKCFEVGQKDAERAVKLKSGGYGRVALKYVEKLKRGEDVNLKQMLDAEIELMEGKSQSKSS